MLFPLNFLFEFLNDLSFRIDDGMENGGEFRIDGPCHGSGIILKRPYIERVRCLESSRHLNARQIFYSGVIYIGAFKKIERP